MAVAYAYGGALLSLANKEIDFDSDTIKVMLCNSSYVPNQDTHRYLSSITGEVTGSGYTAGGKVLTGVNVNYDASVNQVRIDADDISWAPSLITARYAVIYDDTTPTKPLIGYIDFGSDVSSNNASFDIKWNSLTLFRLSAGPMAGGLLPTPAVQPVGVTGNWNLKFQDNFDTGPLNTAVWTPYWFTTAGTWRGVTTDPNNVTVSGGELQLTLSDATHGALISSNPSDGVPGHTGFQFTYGYAEARIYIPGPSASVAYNWAGFTTRGQSYPTDGHSDVVETAGWDSTGSFTTTYHYDSDGNTTPGVFTHTANGITVSGSWANGWHVYGIHRKVGSTDIYWDGVKVFTYSTFDGGRPMYFILSQAQSVAPANQMYGVNGRMRVDYVRYWESVETPSFEDAEPTSGVLRYVSSSTGSDSNPGTKAAPWASLAKVAAALTAGEVGRGDTVMLKRGDTFFGSIQFPVIAKTAGVFTFRPYGSGALPKISGFKVSTNAWVLHSTNIWKLNITANSGQYTGNTSQASTNVGFLMVNGALKGAKKLSLASVTSDWDFYSDGTYVYVKLGTNPGAGIEISVQQNGIRPASNSEVWGMHVIGHGAHGFAQYNSGNVYVHDCIIEWIGGSLLNTDTRYGNGIEVWIGNRDTTYSNNIVRQTYDCGITMQGTQEGTTTQWTNVHIDDNRFENCFQTFEIWSRGSGTGWVSCSFNRNTSLDAGYGWSAGVRGDPDSGVHFLSYDMQLSASGLEIANNYFKKAKNAYAYCTYGNAYPNVNSHDNTIILEAGRKIVWQNAETIEQGTAWKTRTGKEVNSQFYVLGTEPASTDGVMAASVFNWGPVSWGDEFNYVGAPDPNKWSVYDGAGHAGNGIRSPNAWMGDGSVMRVSGDANGTTGGMSSKYDRGIPLYHRVETRMRTGPRDPEYVPVLILWPDNAGGVISGVPEVDYGEGGADITQMRFFLHYGTSSQTFATKTVDTTQWHNYAVEWGPNAVIGYIDGVEWFRDTDPTHIPSTPMHSTIQLDWIPGNSTATNPQPAWMEIMWTRGYDM